MVDTQKIRSRIYELGNHYVVYENQYLLISDYNSAKELYEALTINTPDPLGVVVLGASIEDLSYWGFSSNELWSWLKDIKSGDD